MAAVTVQQHAPCKSSLALELLVGSLSVSGATLATNPLDVIKVRLQLQQRSAQAGAQLGLFRTGYDVFKTNGVQGLYRGVAPAIIRGLTYGGIRLGLYGPLRDALDSLVSASSGVSTSHGTGLLVKVTAGMASGGLAAAMTNPIELVKTRLQAKGAAQSLSAVGVVRTVMKQDGVLGLWRGATPGMVRAALLNASQCAIYDEAKQALLRVSGAPDGPAMHLAASAMAGLVVATATNPPDVIKTYMYMGASAPGAVAEGMLATAARVWRTEGLMAFFKGWLANYARMGPQTTITFMLAEQLREALGMKSL